MDQLNEAISIAIIGGADGPTSIYISCEISFKHGLGK